ncbi:MAG: carbamoyltransferase, partial [bacterium]|nr:carbamoyltransferase [bacterium]
MVILGVCAFHGDCSASILKDGRLIAAVEEERFTRVKHWAGFPEKSIKYCLKEAGVTLNEVDMIAVAKDPKANMRKKMAYVLKNPASWKKVSGKLKNKKTFETFEQLFARAFNMDEGEVKPKIVYVEHHLAHLASAYLVSPFSESALVSIDGFGDFVSAMYGVGKGNRFEVFQRVYYPHSIGVFYTMITQFLGFRKFGDEYKVMGLSSYGEPEFLDQMGDIISYTGGGNYRLNLEYFKHHRLKLDYRWESGEPEFPDIYSQAFVERFGRARGSGEEVTGFHKNFASSMQGHVEGIIFEILEHVYDRVGIDKLSFAGGVAMNSVVNGKIIGNTSFRDVYIPPAAGDAGTSMGAAFYVWNHLLGNERSFRLDSGYWGPEYFEDEIGGVVERYKEKLGDRQYLVSCVGDEEQLIEEVVGEIIGGSVVGWFQGRMEFGARALGNRSIVVDPRRGDMMDILNARIKKRELFRPFAPSVLEEVVGEWFEDSSPVPFMERVYRVREGKRGEIPAVTHVDGTGRLQTVSEGGNGLYYKLIRRFGE